MSNNLTITDNRTKKTYELPIEHGTIKAMDLRQIKTGPEDFGLTADGLRKRFADYRARRGYV